MHSQLNSSYCEQLLLCLPAVPAAQDPRIHNCGLICNPTNYNSAPPPPACLPSPALSQEYRIHNCDLMFKEDSTVDDLIDVIEGNRRYVKCECQQRVIWQLWTGPGIGDHLVLE